MIVKLNNNIVDYKFKVFFVVVVKRYKSILFFFFLNVGLCLKKKSEHATYDIRDSYYKPVAPALCWCNPPGSAPSHRAGLEPGFPVRDAGALTRNAKGYSLERQSLERLFLRSGEWGLHTALTSIHICYIDIPQGVLTRHLRTFFFFLSSLRFLPPGVGLTGSSRPSNVLLEFKALILKTEHKQTLQSIERLHRTNSDWSRGHIAFRLKTGSALIAVWKRTASCSTF